MSFQRLSDVYTTSATPFRRLTYVEKTLRVYWVTSFQLDLNSHIIKFKTILLFKKTYSILILTVLRNDDKLFFTNLKNNSQEQSNRKLIVF